VEGAQAPLKDATLIKVENVSWSEYWSYILEIYLNHYHIKGVTYKKVSNFTKKSFIGQASVFIVIQFNFV
jgi:hypothetical protein